MRSTGPRFLDASAAAQLLGVTRQTLYSYVSRGLLRAHAAPAGRGSVYARAEVERLALRAVQGRKPRAAARRSLDFGLPVLESSLSLIADGELWYRAQRASVLAESSTLEEVAALLWGCGDEIPFASMPPHVDTPVIAEASPLERAMAALPAMAIQLTPLPHEASPAERHARCATLVRCMAAALLNTPVSAAPLHEQCATAWGVDAASAASLRAALVLCADHELNASSFAARVVASTNAQLHAAVLGGLAALSGPRHGAASEAVEVLWDQLAADTTDALVARVLETRSSVPGFGHRLYPSGDPRATSILARLPVQPELAALCGAVQARCGELPNLDLALVALRRALGLPRGSASIIFALGRTVGWLAHALEQQEQGALIRPRASYVGELPSPSAAMPVGRIVKMKHR
ncbi:citrate synthase family protein [Uliginosibacterium sp. H3]|uniref:citrate synthase (unknown stereospecificity) n=1 Tax=Uliginosibacterium silvisoli TaxID=3114758 RepID=A0ABU6K012_9RHOO|nr:citrate synthase family protein [Uliginosibacterium sp. H3]